jgi:hypothetical protein
MDMSIWLEDQNIFFWLINLTKSVFFTNTFIQIKQP